jgi:hypothetical protein
LRDADERDLSLHRERLDGRLERSEHLITWSTLRPWLSSSTSVGQALFRAVVDHHLGGDCAWCYSS